MITQAYEANLGAPVDLSGQPPPSPNTVREPRTRVGLRQTPQDDFDIDLIWSRNITGGNAHWLTLGFDLRF